MMWRYLIAWFGMMVLAIANGLIREYLLVPQMAERAAHQASTVLLLVLFALYFWWLFRRWPTGSARRAWLIGAVWLVMTIAFEWGLGLAGGLTVPELLNQYNLANGNLWILIPLFVLVGPYLFQPRPHTT